MEKAVAPHSSTVAWKIPRTEEPGGLQSMGSLRVGHDWATSLSLFTFMHWRRKWQPAPVFLSGDPRDGGTWWAAVYGVAQSRTRLKWLSSSCSSRTRDKIFPLHIPNIQWWDRHKITVINTAIQKVGQKKKKAHWNHWSITILKSSWIYVATSLTRGSVLLSGNNWPWFLVLFSVFLITSFSTENNLQ